MTVTPHHPSVRTSQQIRQDFIEFFSNRGHQVVRSAPVVPHDDPTLLFSNAGMNQFKDVFLGTGTRDYSRAVDTQKCIRASGKHNDLEDVGRDNYHHTFFEMLGNWSFGDYFKKDAIVWAWELCTEVWKLPKAKLWATVFEGYEPDGLGSDSEAEDFWKTNTDINSDHVLRCNKHDNFWEMGNVGPCGPCSELHFDLGEGTCPLSEEHDCAVNVDDCWRFVELWNLVFIQYQRIASGTLEPLAESHVDTGMGLERVCRVLQNVDSNYATDLFVPILDHIAKITGKADESGEVGVAFRVIADHLRSLSFAIADGAIPSNEGRGYVLRRMLRRATRFGRVLNMESPFIFKLVPTLIQIMGDVFPELKARQSHIMGVIEAEEASFGRTLDRGLEIFEQMLALPQTQSSQKLSGADAFKLYDTYGFPLDLTSLMCEEQNILVDEEGFSACMEAQRSQSRDAAQFAATLESWSVLSEGEDSIFVGYNTSTTDSKIRKYTAEGADKWLVVLDQTPFYAESGGQVADQGVLKQDAHSWKVTHVRKEGSTIVHVCEGDSEPDGTALVAEFDVAQRISTARNHTATHLLQAALREVLGEHVNQAGSVVHSDYLRFDFTHFEKPTTSQLEQIASRVNEEIQSNHSLMISEMAYADAIESGITALFGEKYGDVVRVVEVSEFSKELCGGCHVGATGEIGYFQITSEGGIASGVRRIVALTGVQSGQNLTQKNRVIQELRQLMNVPLHELTQQTQRLLEQKQSLEKELRALKKQLMLQNTSALVDSAQVLAGIPVLIHNAELDSVNALRELGDHLCKQLDSGIVILIASLDSKHLLLCRVSEDLVKRKLKAAPLVNLVAAVADGRGGGKPHMAQAGIKSPEKIPQLLLQAPNLVREYLEQQF